MDWKRGEARKGREEKRKEGGRKERKKGGKERGKEGGQEGGKEGRKECREEGRKGKTEKGKNKLCLLGLKNKRKDFSRAPIPPPLALLLMGKNTANLE